MLCLFGKNNNRSLPRSKYVSYNALIVLSLCSSLLVVSFVNVIERISLSITLILLVNSVYCSCNDAVAVNVSYKCLTKPFSKVSEALNDDINAEQRCMSLLVL